MVGAKIEDHVRSRVTGFSLDEKHTKYKQRASPQPTMASSSTASKVSDFLKKKILIEHEIVS